MAAEFKKIMYKLSILLILVAVFFLPVVYFNIVIDPFGIFHINSQVGDNLDKNQRYIKVRYILENPQKYDTYLFRSSRAGHVPLQEDASVKGFNFAYSIGLPNEHLEDLKVMLANKVNVKTVIIAVDDISYLSIPSATENTPLRFSYEVYKNNPFLFYLNYIFLPPDTSLIKQNLSPVVTSAQMDEKVEQDPQAHNKLSLFNSPSVPKPQADLVDATINSLAQIKELCVQNNIKLIIYVNPLHITTYKALDFNLFSKFLTKLADITPFYNFSGINYITTNNYYYYETSHFRTPVGRMIMQKILHNTGDFGNIIDKSNVQAYIIKAQTDLQNYNSKSGS